MNLFKLVATVGLDTREYDRGVDEATRKGRNMGQTIGKGVAAAGKMLATGLTAATTAVGALTVAAVKSYAQYEQLVGGVETLFKTSAIQVKAYAEQAYKTAGMSANEYMETVTGFSASLIQSLGGDTDKAAKVADMAIRDMSDNANKMGTSMKSIQFAYQGFAKGNMTMLDNLKLGYGGTKEEMQRLIDDANKVKEANGEMADLSMDSFADMVEAIHIIQTEMDITGTTAKEADKTIEGSVNAMKGAFKNLVTGFGRDNANLTVLTKNAIESVVTVAGNIVPRIGQVLEGIKEVGMQLAPKLAEGLSEMVNGAPVFLESAMDVLRTLGGALIDQAPALLDSSFKLLETLLDGLNSHPDEVFSSIEKLVGALATSIRDNGPTIFAKARDLVIGLGDSFVEHAPEIIIGAVQIMAEMARGLADNLPAILNKIPEWINKLVTEFTSEENLKALWTAGSKLATAILQGFKDIFVPGFGGLFTWLGKIFSGDFAGAWEDTKTGLGGFFSNPVGTISGWFNGESPVTYQAPNGANGWLAGYGDSAVGSMLQAANQRPKPRPGSPASGWNPYKDGSHANGLDYVPWDGYIAELHEGERVLTAEEARSAGNTYNTTINVNGYNRDPEELAEALQGLIDRRAAANA